MWVQLECVEREQRKNIHKTTTYKSHLAYGGIKTGELKIFNLGVNSSFLDKKWGLSNPKIV